MATQNDRYLAGSIGSATAGDTLQIRNVSQKGQGGPLYLLVHVSGTFSGTIGVEVAPPGSTAFAPYATPVVGTAAFAQYVLIPADCDVRLNVSAYTSGTFTYYMALPA